MLGYSQRDLAETLDVSHSQVSKWEMGERDMTVATLERLLGLVDGSVELRHGDGEPLEPMHTPGEELLDRAGRRYPAHLDVQPCHEQDPFDPQAGPHHRAIGRRSDRWRRNPYPGWVKRPWNGPVAADPRHSNHPTFDAVLAWRDDYFTERRERHQRLLARPDRPREDPEDLSDCTCPDTCCGDVGCLEDCPCQCDPCPPRLRQPQPSTPSPSDTKNQPTAAPPTPPGQSREEKPRARPPELSAASLGVQLPTAPKADAVRRYATRSVSGDGPMGQPGKLEG